MSSANTPGNQQLSLVPDRNGVIGLPQPSSPDPTPPQADFTSNPYVVPTGRGEHRVIYPGIDGPDMPAVAAEQPKLLFKTARDAGALAVPEVIDPSTVHALEGRNF
jgi:hypothetical protein